MIESACPFGDRGRLHGVLTAPAAAGRAAPTLVLVSAGFMGKSGPYGLYRQIARDLARRGVRTLRFDLGGIGNSDQVDTALPLEERTRIDIRAAIDFLEAQGAGGPLVLGGLCSGAEDSFRYAAEDERVRGVVMLDPHAYRTTAWRLRNLLSRHFFNRVVYKLLRVTRLIDLGEEARRASEAEGFEGDLINYQYLPETEARRLLGVLIGRGTRFHYIFTGGRLDTFNHRGQFYAMFRGIDFAGLETVTHLPHIEHVQVFEEDRRELVRVVGDWVAASFPAAAERHGSPA